jgi:hypothetical protein
MSCEWGGVGWSGCPRNWLSRLLDDKRLKTLASKMYRAYSRFSQAWNSQAASCFHWGMVHFYRTMLWRHHRRHHRRRHAHIMVPLAKLTKIEQSKFKQKVGPGPDTALLWRHQSSHLSRCTSLLAGSQPSSVRHRNRCIRLSFSLAPSSSNTNQSTSGFLQ